MPYASNDKLPKEIRDALPSDAQSQFRAVVNSAIKDGDSEESAFAQAWGAVHQSWKKGEDGKWVKKSGPTSSSVHSPGTEWREKGFNPDQPRDENGRFGSTGGSGVESIIEGNIPGAKAIVEEDEAGNTQVFISGGGVKEMQFTVADDELHVEQVILEESARGSDAGRGAMRTIHDSAVAGDVDSITMRAGYESGGYVWGKIGFQTSQPDVVATEAKKRLEKIGAYDSKNNPDGIPKALYNKASKIIDQGGPSISKDLANLANPIGSGQASRALGRSIKNPTLGKSLMLGQTYAAHLPKSDFGNLSKYAGRK